ncbi:MAG TPA: cell division protein FtsK [Micromonospora sp.]|nr:cell division protein FtsK [Micromonospora sp.]
MTTMNFDAEMIEGGPRALGGPVDPPERPTTFAAVVSREDSRRPIVPASLRSPDQRRQLARWTAGYATHAALYHVTRSPKYAAKVAMWSPVGAARLVGRALRWAMAEEGNWHLRQQAANRNDPHTWLQLDRVRERQSRWRWWVLAGGLLALIALVLVLASGLAPWWSPWAALVVVVPVLARMGRPADRPIVDRVHVGERFTRLTAEMVRAALVDIGAAKEPGALTFPQEVHRDGPGYLARVNLPTGVEAVTVLERRGRLSSALRLPVDQVWPAVGPEHAGQVDLWVGLAPASKMGQPRWSLAADNARTSVFEPVEFGTDERQRPVTTPLFARNFLIGGVPGSGKSYAARTLAIAAALDPTCELKIAEFKGTADFGDLAHLCSAYACGVDDAALTTGAEILAWGLAEAERRGERIRRARERGEAPEGKVTTELAARPGSGLHPVLILIDEAHELFGDPAIGKNAAVAAERLIKRGRALGLMVVLATQIPDRTSLPPNITRCVNVRWCLAVQDQVANDMILGTGAYKRGQTATAYRPVVDAGWGIITGLEEPTPVRSHYPDPKVTARIVARATQLRGGVVGDQDDTTTARRDVLDDVLRVFATVGRRGLHWQTIAEQFAAIAPETYAEISADAVSALVRDKGVPSVDVKSEGVTRKGCRRAEIESAIARREITAE